MPPGGSLPLDCESARLHLSCSVIFHQRYGDVTCLTRVWCGCVDAINHLCTRCNWRRLASCELAAAFDITAWQRQQQQQQQQPDQTNAASNEINQRIFLRVNFSFSNSYKPPNAAAEWAVFSIRTSIRDPGRYESGFDSKVTRVLIRLRCGSVLIYRLNNIYK